MSQESGRVMESVKPVSWSYSSLSLFQQCPHKYYRLRITKDIVEPPAEHLLYGSEAHRIAEEFVRDKIPYLNFRKILDPRKKLERPWLMQGRRIT